MNSGAISKVESHPEQIVSRVFSVPKNNGGHRLILDLSNTNKFIQKIHFKMESYDIIQSLIEPNDFLASIDLENAFHAVKLHESSRKYTVFQVNNVRYCYNVLPFGFSSSPRIFSKILKIVE